MPSMATEERRIFFIGLYGLPIFIAVAPYGLYGSLKTSNRLQVKTLAVNFFEKQKGACELEHLTIQTPQPAPAFPLR
jgi:hypothetical protein